MSAKVLKPVEGESNEQYKQRFEKTMQEEPGNHYLKMQYAGTYLEAATRFYLKNEFMSKKRLINSEMFLEFKKHAKQIKPHNALFDAFIDLTNGNNKSAMENIQKWFKSKPNELDPFLYERPNVFNYDVFVHLLVRTLKEGYAGMWSAIKGLILATNDYQRGIPEMCNALEVFFHSGCKETTIDAMSAVLRIDEDFIVANEMLGYTYYQMKMWKNAIAYFERVPYDKIPTVSIQSCEDFYGKTCRMTYFGRANIYYYLGWAFGKTKNLKEEETYYRKRAALYSDEKNGWHNNLGWCLYKQKRYDEAIEVFEYLIEIKSQWDLPYAANNLVRCLLAKGVYKKAIDFIHSYDGKIAKDIRERADTLYKKHGAVCPLKTEEQDFLFEIDDEDDYLPVPDMDLDTGIKGEQFSSEKLLEDELVLRLENGRGAFGLPLSIYETKGNYGRQYIIPVGRLDILAVDKDDNYYVIELKKDAGYGDVYQQVIDYMKWCEKNMAKNSQKVYGIICLNSPNKSLIEKVNANPMIRLFEYTVAFNEVVK